MMENDLGAFKEIVTVAMESVSNHRKRQTYPRIDRHETIVTGRCETFRYCHIGGKGMTSAELKRNRTRRGNPGAGDLQ